MGEAVFKEVFQSYGQAVANEFAKNPMLMPNAVRLAYIRANFDWYKNQNKVVHGKYYVVLAWQIMPQVLWYRVMIR